MMVALLSFIICYVVGDITSLRLQGSVIKARMCILELTIQQQLKIITPLKLLHRKSQNFMDVALIQKKIVFVGRTYAKSRTLGVVYLVTL